MMLSWSLYGELSFDVTRQSFLTIDVSPKSIVIETLHQDHVTSRMQAARHSGIATNVPVKRLKINILLEGPGWGIRSH